VSLFCISDTVVQGHACTPKSTATMGSPQPLTFVPMVAANMWW
jgi:hypothetical protein